MSSSLLEQTRTAVRVYQIVYTILRVILLLPLTEQAPTDQGLLSMAGGTQDGAEILLWRQADGWYGITRGIVDGPYSNRQDVIDALTDEYLHSDEDEEHSLTDAYFPDD